MIVNEAVVRLAGYQYDRPYAPRGMGYAKALANSGAGAILLPYRVHRAGSTAEVGSLMPIDRRITIQIRGEDQRDRYGELVPGAINYFPVWAGRFDKNLEDISEIAGERSEIRRAWRVRWFSQLAGITDLERVAVEDAGIEFDVENLVEETGKDGRTRRRWLMIEGVYST